MATAFVSGATGYTGREVVRELVARGIHTVAHVRPDSSSRSEWGARFTALGAQVDYTPWNEQAMAETLARHGADYVFALLGTTRARARRAARTGADASYEAVDYGLSVMLLRATRKAVPQARFIYLSAVGVSGPSRNPYMDVRWRVERELHESGLRYLIAKPAFITGTDRSEKRTAERVAARLIDGMLAVAGAIGFRTQRDRYQSLTGRQLGAALVSAALGASENLILDTAALRQLAPK